jgi:hypothetical protein
MPPSSLSLNLLFPIFPNFCIPLNSITYFHLFLPLFLLFSIFFFIACSFSSFHSHLWKKFDCLSNFHFKPSSWIPIYFISLKLTTFDFRPVTVHLITFSIPFLSISFAFFLLFLWIFFSFPSFVENEWD